MWTSRGLFIDCDSSIYNINSDGSGYFKVLTSRLRPFLYKLWPHGWTAQKHFAWLIYFLGHRRWRQKGYKGLLEIIRGLSSFGQTCWGGEGWSRAKFFLAIWPITLGGGRELSKYFEIDTPNSDRHFSNICINFLNSPIFSVIHWRGGDVFEPGKSLWQLGNGCILDS